MDQKFSAFARAIMEQKYSHELLPDGTKESWEDIAKRVTTNVMKAVTVSKQTVKDIEKLIADRKFMPGGRYLYASGRPYHQVQNCYAGETKVVTRHGTKTLAQLAGTEPILMTSNGGWVKAPVSSFGKQKLLEVTLTRAGIEKKIYATADHEWKIAKNVTKAGWPVNKISVKTSDLKSGMELWTVFGFGVSRTTISLAGIQHGIVYGDGNVPGDDWGFNTANVRLCGEKDRQLLKYFDGYRTRNIETDIEVGGLPRFLKEKPALTHDRSYLAGWLAGYIAADGCVSSSGKVVINSTDYDSLQHVRDVCYILGIGSYAIGAVDRISNLTGEPSRLYGVTFMRHTLTSDMFLLDQHRIRFENNPPKRSECSWHVVSVNVTDRSEEVFCATVPETHEFVLEDNILTGNCLLLRAEDSREGWADLMHKSSMALMTGAGIGVVYGDVRAEGKPIRKTGGLATGPLALMQMVNETGRGIMQGGSRRSAIWAGLRWDHQDIHKFITMKNWIPEVRALKEKDYNFPATMDGTNISVGLNDAFFQAYDDEKHKDHSLAQGVYWATVRQMLKTAEPGFSVDCGINRGEELRNACVAGDTEFLTRVGYRRIDSMIGKKIEAWNGFEWSTVEPKVTGHNREMVTVHLSSGQSLTCTRNHQFWISTDYRGGESVVDAQDLKIGMKLIKTEMPVIEEGRYVPYAYSRGFSSGIGSDETLVPFEWNLQSRTNWLAGLLDADGKELPGGEAQLGSQDRLFLLNIQKMLTTMGVTSKVTFDRGGCKDFPCQDLYRLLIGSCQIQSLKALGLHCGRLSFNKTPQRDASQFVAVTAVEDAGTADITYCFNEPLRHLGCFEGVVTGQCTEITSRDDSDICNLGSINMAQIESLEEMQKAVELGTLFLLAGTVYSDVPYSKVDQIRTKNRRLGLGLMGLHEWLLKKGKKYGPDEELEKYLKIYATSTEIAAKYADEWELSHPVKTRAIAPTGTIGIVAETTTGMEPIFCVAYKRRYLKGSVVHYQYVIDPCAQRLIDQGVNPELIEDAYSLAENVERRVEFQAWLQKYVDHGISSTVNIPSWGSEQNNDSKVREFGDMLMRHLPNLRGMTCYPDGARGGQPLTPIKYATAIKHVGEIFMEQADVCDLTRGGTCGS